MYLGYKNNLRVVFLCSDDKETETAPAADWFLGQRQSRKIELRGGETPNSNRTPLPACEAALVALISPLLFSQ